jgi:hypothetical protein
LVPVSFPTAGSVEASLADAKLVVSSIPQADLHANNSVLVGQPVIADSGAPRSALSHPYRIGLSGANKKIVGRLLLMLPADHIPEGLIFKITNREGSHGEVAEAAQQLRV